MRESKQQLRADLKIMTKLNELDMFSTRETLCQPVLAQIVAGGHRHLGGGLRQHPASGSGVR